MGIFDEMLAGTAAGLGRGISEYGAMRQREDEKQALLDERLAQQRQMQLDRFQQQKDMLDLKSSLTGGHGSDAGKGFNLFQMMLGAKTPEEQDKVVNLARMIDPNAGAAIADQMYGRPLTQQSTVNQPTTGDLARFDRGQQDSIPESQTVTSRVDYDKQKGAVALQRMYALILDPAKADNQANAERQWTQNDFGIAGAQQVRKDGGDAVDAAEAFGTLSNPKLNTSRNDVDARRLEAQARREEAINDRANADRDSRDRNKALSDARLAWQTAVNQGASKDVIDSFYKDYISLKRETSSPSASQQAAAPKYPYKGRSPAEAAAAYKGK